MSKNHYANVRVGVLVKRHDSKWIPFTHEMFYCKQKEDGLVDWALESVGLLGVLGGLPGEHKMKIGESRKYWVHATLTYSEDYWGEADEDMEIISMRRCK